MQEQKPLRQHLSWRPLPGKTFQSPLHLWRHVWPPKNATFHTFLVRSKLPLSLELLILQQSPFSLQDFWGDPRSNRVPSISSPGKRNKISNTLACWYTEYTGSVSNMKFYVWNKIVSKRNCVKSFEITQNHQGWSMSEWQCDSLNHDIRAMMPWHLCDVAHNKLLQVAELVEKTWQEVDRGTTLRQSHTMLEHWSDLVLAKKMAPPYIFYG